MKSPRIALLGLGSMGSRIAQNLLNANYAVVIYNRTADKLQPLLEQGATAAKPLIYYPHASVLIVPDEAVIDLRIWRICRISLFSEYSRENSKSKTGLG